MAATSHCENTLQLDAGGSSYENQEILKCELLRGFLSILMKAGINWCMSQVCRLVPGSLV